MSQHPSPASAVLFGAESQLIHNHRAPMYRVEWELGFLHNIFSCHPSRGQKIPLWSSVSHLCCSESVGDDDYYLCADIKLPVSGGTIGTRVKHTRRLQRIPRGRIWNRVFTLRSALRLRRRMSDWHIDRRHKTASSPSFLRFIRHELVIEVFASFSVVVDTLEIDWRLTRLQTNWVDVNEVINNTAE